MAGIYIHIPFCKSRCVYCGFYSTTCNNLRQQYVDCICREWQLRHHYVNGHVRTIYIGGGTPSQLDGKHLRQIFDCVGSAEEVTIECNPDDMTADYAGMLSQLPVNRVSMGAQSFSDSRLRLLRRRHTSQQIEEAVANLRAAGFGNISIDLMYGFPGETLDEWRRDIDKALSLEVEHISAYALMYEEGTELYRQLEKGMVTEVDEEQSLLMYDTLVDRLTAAGYEHYEISNFAKPGRRSVHNSNYWNQTPYVGLGAAAHSYDRESRQWNVADIGRYMQGVEGGRLVFEKEILDEQTKYNDLVMTALRTCEGLRLNELGEDYRRYCLQGAQRFIDDGLMTIKKDSLRLTRKGIFVSDMMMSELMWV
ncbi:MAG: radical SAM family heme chaperone HemW [Prevotella sp.]|nr:radical SAM family heme chaperone HemW [Prevotella sp.]